MTSPTQIAVACLNEAFRRDPAALHALMINRVPCNGELADDPHVVVDGNHALSEGRGATVGALGLINGVLSALGHPPVAVKFGPKQDNGRSAVVGFVEYSKATQ